MVRGAQAVEFADQGEPRSRRAAPTNGLDVNARVDRSIQATLAPGRLAIDYEVSLSELTLTQDLRC